MRRKSCSPSGSTQIHTGRQQRQEVRPHVRKGSEVPILTVISGSKFERNLPAPDLPRESFLELVLAINADTQLAPTSEQVRDL
jgi:hypothetical protein